MLESDVSLETSGRDDHHDRWLAMQSAYKEYRRASDVLESVDESIADSATEELVRLGVLERQQRVAFERYVEARVDYLEFQYDTSYRLRAAQSASSPFDAAKWILPGIAFIVLCAMALWLIREHNRLQSLEVARDELRVALHKTRAEIQFTPRPDAPRPLPTPPVAAPQSAGQHSQRARQSRGSRAIPPHQRKPQIGSPARRSGVRKSERITASVVR